jgi:hypothetical protein
MIDPAKAAAAGCGAALVAAGTAGLWRAPLTWDERQYYAPAIRFFSDRLPCIPLNYPAPSPPVGFILQSIVYRATGSFTVVRMLSTVATIVVLFIIADWVKGSRRGALMVVMAASFAPMTTYAFSLKQHWFTLLFLVLGFVAWQSGRQWLAAGWLLLAVGTNQIAVAFILMVLIRQLGRRALWVPHTLPLAAMGALAVYWHGPQPPMFRLAGVASQPAFLHFVWSQLLLLAFECGVWIVPLFALWWRKAVLTLPSVAVAVFLVGWSGMLVMRPDPDPRFFERAVGPVIGTIRLFARNELISLVVVSMVISIGWALWFMRRDDDVASVQTYAAMYAVTMLQVPFLFESYYAMLVLVSWMILGRRAAETRSRDVLVAQLAAIVFGLVYLVFKFQRPS